jgi:hypothetical protein
MARDLALVLCMVAVVLISGCTSEVSHIEEHFGPKTTKDCTGANALIQGSIFDDESGTLSLSINNFGDVNLSFDIRLDYSQGPPETRSGFSVESGKTETFEISNVDSDLSLLSVISNECPTVEDFISSSAIVGL